MVDWNQPRPTRTCTLYADSAQTQPIYEIIFTGDRSTGLVTAQISNALPVQRSLLPRNAEQAPLASTLNTISVSGSNIMFAVSSPVAGVHNVGFKGLQSEGAFTSTPVLCTGDNAPIPVSLGINGSNPTGDYDIVMTGPDGKTESRVRVHWEIDTRQLSLCAGFRCSVAPVNCAVTEQMQLLRALIDNPTVGDNALSAMQQESLTEGLRQLGSPYSEIASQGEAAFWAAHPEWRDDVIHDTVMRIAATSSFTPTQIYEGLMRDRASQMNAMLGAGRQLNAALGELLQEGLRVLSAIRAGGNEGELRRTFAITVDRYNTSLVRAQAGTRTTSADELLDAVKMIWQNKSAELIDIRVGETQLVAQQQYRDQLVASGFIQDIGGTMMAANDPRLQQVTYYVDANKRLTILPPGGTTVSGNGNLGGNVIGGGSNALVQEIAAQHLFINLKQGEQITSPINVNMQPNKTSIIEFVIDEDKMVSFGTTGIIGRDLTLEIAGSGLGEKKYPSQKIGMTGESVSLRLPMGTYTLSIKDNSMYYMANSELGNTPFSVSVETNIKPYNSANIEGKISIDGSEKTMPIGMRAIAFNNVGERISKDPDTGKDLILDPSKPVWVVIHGRTDSPDSDNMRELERSLSLLGKDKNFQVVIIDWREAARDVLKILGIDVGLEDASWTPAVGAWAGQRLLDAGFAPSQVFFGVHSHGSYGGFFAAKYMMDHTEGDQKAGGIIALDSAKNPIFVGANINEADIQLKEVARYSLAFHSSFLGSIDRSLSADNTIIVGTNHSNNGMVKQHSDSVNALTDLLDAIKTGDNKNVANMFTLSSELGLRLRTLSSAYGYDALMTIQDKTSTEHPSWHPIDITGISLRTNTGGWSDLLVDPAHQPLEGVNYKPSIQFP